MIQGIVRLGRDSSGWHLRNNNSAPSFRAQRGIPTALAGKGGRDSSGW